MKFAILLILCIVLTACGDTGQQAVIVTDDPVSGAATAPFYTATPTLTPTLTPSVTLTPSATPTLTLTPSDTPTVTPTASETPTPSLTPTPPLMTLTPPTSLGMPEAIRVQPAGLSAATGWSCDDFPCEDDIAGFMRRIQVAPGFALEYVGQFPGQPLQIAYGRDRRLYATVLLDGTRDGAVYVMNADGQTERYAAPFVSPVGLAFQPGTDVLYVSSRATVASGGIVWRVPYPGADPEIVLDDLPCCYSVIDNQPNGMVFGPDGYLYLGVGSLTDHAEPANPEREPYAAQVPYEAAVLRINPHTAEIEVYAEGIRNPYDIAFASTGQFYATDDGLALGPGDRLLALQAGGHYGWPYYRLRGCGSDCPPRPGRLETLPDFVTFTDYSLPRGVAVYTGRQFPSNMFDTVFVALWNGTPYAQRIVWIDPDDSRLHSDDEAVVYEPEPFVTGLIRPVDVVVAPDGALVIADFIYGHVWRVTYVGAGVDTQSNSGTDTQTRPATAIPQPTLPATEPPPFTLPSVTPTQ